MKANKKFSTISAPYGQTPAITLAYKVCFSVPSTGTGEVNYLIKNIRFITIYFFKPYFCKGVYTLKSGTVPNSMELGMNPLIYLNLYLKTNHTPEDLGELISECVSIEINLHTATIKQFKMVDGKWQHAHIILYYLTHVNNFKINEKFDEVRAIAVDRDVASHLKQFFLHYSFTRNNWGEIGLRYGLSLF